MNVSGLYNGHQPGIHNGLFGSSDPNGLDVSTLAFVQVAQILRGSEIAAIDYMVKKFKQTGLWEKCKALYPMVGGTASSHKFNLKDPQDTNASYRLTFTGGMTHDYNGVTLNGTNGTMITNLLNTELPTENFHMAVYSKTDGQTGFDISGSSIPRTQLILSYINGAGDTYHDLNNTGNATRFANSFTPTGLYISSRSFNRNRLFRRGVMIRNVSATANAPSAIVFQIGRYTGGLSPFSNRNYAFASFGLGLSSDEAMNMDRIVQDTQIILGRAAY